MQPSHEKSFTLLHANNVRRLADAISLPGFAQAALRYLETGEIEPLLPRMLQLLQTDRSLRGGGGTNMLHQCPAIVVLTLMLEVLINFPIDGARSALADAYAKSHHVEWGKVQLALVQEIQRVFQKEIAMQHSTRRVGGDATSWMQRRVEYKHITTSLREGSCNELRSHIIGAPTP